MTSPMPRQSGLTPEAVALLNMMASGIRTKDAGTTPGAQLHGPGGLLATQGMNRGIWNAMIVPRGLSGKIPIRPSVDTNDIIPILTGQLAVTGNAPTAACTDWPLAGQFKICRQMHPFGRQGLQSQVLQLDNVGQIVNRGEFRDQVLLGEPATDNGNLPGPVNWASAMQREYEKKLAELYLGYYRHYATRFWTGNPQTSAGSTGDIQYRGLDLLINTGKRDAITGVACPAADSIVIDLNGTNINSNGGAFYDIAANTILNLDRLAEQVGLNVDWAIVMRGGLFMQLTAVWPCIYATSHCLPGANIVRTSSLEEQTQMRDEMRNGRYLLIEGKQYPVIVDDNLTETIAAGNVVGTYQSDAYFVPLRANGEPTLYWEYFNMDAEAIQAAASMAPQGFFSTLDGGRFLFLRLSPTHTCMQIEIIEKPRLVLATPFLAAKWQNIRYSYSIHERTPFTSDTYFVNGGLPVTPLPYFYPNSSGG